MSTSMSVQAFCTWNSENLAQEVCRALQARFPDSRSAVKQIARLFNVSTSLAGKWFAGQRPPSGPQLLNMVEYFGPSFLDEIRGCPDESKEEVFQLVTELEERLKRWK